MTPEQSNVFLQDCKKCGRTNKVSVQRPDGFGEAEEYFCAYCGLEMGAFNAKETPETELVD